MRYPRNLKIGDYIGVTAPSEGISKIADMPRLDNVKNNFAKLGYNYLETPNVRTNNKGRSSSAEERAKQFLELWKNDDVGAIISATGGNFIAEMIDKLDFEEMKKLEPKWFQGYSNNTELTFLFTTILDIACIYGQTIKDFGMADWHQNLKNSIEIMSGKEIVQESFEKCETNEWTERKKPLAGYNLVEQDIWKNLKCEEEIKFKGRSIGGCFDDIINLIGTKYDKVKEYIENYKDDGIVWFLEIYEMSTPQVFLNLWQMKNAGYFNHCNGIIFGRSLMLREDYDISFKESVQDALKDLKIPVIYDADIGHVSPQMPIVSGAILEVESKNGKGKIKNYFK